MNIGSKIQQLRKESNLTQAELAEKLIVSPQAVSKWENNQSEPDFETISKMCKIFNISISKFNEEDEEQQEISQPKVAQPTVEQKESKPKIINGYCETCKKPVGPNEYAIEHSSHGRGRSVQHIYCNSCYNNIKKSRLASKIDENSKELRSGIIWGIVAGVIALLVSIIICATNNLAIFAYFLCVIPSLAFFAMVSQIIWDIGIISDVFLFFCHSFSAPFGLIFDLSLDGLIWLITVKLALWIICGILSALLFILGLCICLPLSLITWGFSLTTKRNEITNDLKSYNYLRNNKM